MPHDYSNICRDSAHPDVFLTAEPALGTVAYNWRTGRRTVLNARPLIACGPAGFLFAADARRGWRFSLDDPQGQPIDRVPDADLIATDGSAQIYASADGPDTAPTELWASSDAGRTWELGPPLSAPVALNTARLSPRDARVLYLGFWIYPVFATPPPGYAPDGVYYGISTDGGQSVTLGTMVHEPLSAAGPSIRLRPALERFGSIWSVLKITGDGGGETADYDYSISTDGLHTFHDVGASYGTLSSGRTVDLVPTPAGLVRLTVQGTNTPDNRQMQTILDLARSPDSGQTWQSLTAPIPMSTTAPLTEQSIPIRLLGTREVPAILVFQQGPHLYQSQDNGDHWQALPDSSIGGDLSLTTYEPVTLLDTQSGGRVFALDLPVAHAPFVAPVPPSEAPASHYFPATGHTLERALAGYWQAHGGLAQLGYPLTEAFHQVSATDGKIYLTQYLERAVLERHPENSSPYDILPSLLGVAAYHERYGAAGAPNQQPNSDNPRYFAETGHTLGGRFRAYWDAHGGLAQQGYPISDEFTEVNTLNGQPYRVQYFQRAVFEAHPENQPPFDVLLSQLGTVRAQQLGQGAP